jgi:hypothetical protein
MRLILHRKTQIPISFNRGFKISEEATRHFSVAYGKSLKGNAYYETCIRGKNDEFKEEGSEERKTTGHS